MSDVLDDLAAPASGASRRSKRLWDPQQQQADTLAAVLAHDRLPRRT